MNNWVIDNFCFNKRDSDILSAPLCEDIYRINSKKWNCWMNSMYILIFANFTNFFKKMFTKGTLTSRGCSFLPASLGRQLGREGILAGSWRMTRVWWGRKVRAVLWGWAGGSQDHPLAWRFVRTHRTQKNCYVHGLWLIIVKGHRLKLAKGKKAQGQKSRRNQV